MLHTGQKRVIILCEETAPSLNLKKDDKTSISYPFAYKNFDGLVTTQKATDHSGIVRDSILRNKWNQLLSMSAARRTILRVLSLLSTRYGATIFRILRLSVEFLSYVDFCTSINVRFTICEKTANPRNSKLVLT